MKYRTPVASWDIPKVTSKQLQHILGVVLATDNAHLKFFAAAGTCKLASCKFIVG